MIAYNYNPTTNGNFSSFYKTHKTGEKESRTQKASNQFHTAFTHNKIS
jgi:hypothetical protein